MNTCGPVIDCYERLFSVPLDGSEALVSLADPQVSRFAITPDSSFVVFPRTGGDQALYSVPIDGSAPPMPSI